MGNGAPPIFLLKKLSGALGIFPWCFLKKGYNLCISFKVTKLSFRGKITTPIITTKGTHAREDWAIVTKAAPRIAPFLSFFSPQHRTFYSSVVSSTRAALRTSLQLTVQRPVLSLHLSALTLWRGRTPKKNRIIFL